jgi:hypothetical protein
MSGCQPPGHAAIRPSSSRLRYAIETAAAPRVLDWRERLVCIEETATGRGTWQRDYEVPAFFCELLRGGGSSTTGGSSGRGIGIGRGGSS